MGDAMSITGTVPKKRRPQPKGGSRKGVPNKVTTEFRDTVRKLLEDNAANVDIWLSQVAKGNGNPDKADPARALDLLAKLAEYAAPKLGRVEHVGDGGGPIKQERTVTFVKPE
jgi:hypothetical protein